MRAKPLRGIATLAFGFGVAASCRTEPGPPPVTAPTPAITASVPPPVAELAAPRDAAAPEAANAGADAAPAVVAPVKDPLRRPDPGPGQVACGDAACKAGTEICAPREECVERKDKACVALADFRARKYASTACVDGCFSWFDEKACDGPSDCKAGEVCCYDSDLIIGPCDDGEDGMIDVYQCKPAGKGRTPCGTAELCSAKDSKCTRAGSTCVVSPETGLGRCVVPRRRAAQPDPVNECDRGRDCAPDEACFESPSGRRCDLSAVSWAGQDLPVCVDASDCKGLCGAKDAVCYEPAPGERKFCECRPPCNRDADCKKSDYCSGLSFNRYGGALLKLEPFCDMGRRRCNCREPAQP